MQSLNFTAVFVILGIQVVLIAQLATRQRGGGEALMRRVKMHAVSYPTTPWSQRASLIDRQGARKRLTSNQRRSLGRLSLACQATCAMQAEHVPKTPEGKLCWCVSRFITSG